jgi:hypothetical protein
MRAWAQVFDKHKKIARITFPIWLYVAVTGVVVYLMISPFMLDKTKGNTKLENRVMKHRITILFFILSFFFSLNVETQCAMCRAALGGESNSAGSGSE